MKCPIRFKDVIVITTKELAKVYNCSERNISDNFKNNESKFKEGKHYYKLQGEDLKQFILYSEKIGLQISSKTRVLYLWTHKGASRHCKMLGTDEAWEQFDILEENYFNPRIPQLTKKDELILNLYNSNGGQEALMISKELVAIEVEEATKPLIDTIDILKPAADYTNNVLNPGNAIKLLTVTDISKDLGMSAQALNLKLHKLGVQYKRGGYWKFYSKYDYLIPEYADYVIDEYGQYLKWTEKGRQWIIEFLEKNDKEE